MASPNDPNKPLGDRDKVSREVGAHVGYGWIWVSIAIIIILVIWFEGFGWGGYGGWWWGSHPHTAVVPHNENAIPANPPPGIGQPEAGGSHAALGGDGVQILTAADKHHFIKQPFVIRHVPVQKVNNDRAFWIGANNSDTMLVVLTGNAASNKIQQGERVNLSGRVSRAPSADQAKRMWSLSDEEAKRLEQQGAFVQATQVQTEQAGSGQQ